jgi:N utilization substance protein A
LTALAGVGAKTIEKIEAAGITNVEKLAGMTPEQLMEIPGIGEKMVDKIYQAVNRFYEGGAEAAAPAGENADDMAVEGEAAPAEGEAAVENGEASAGSAEGEAVAEEAAAAESEAAASAAGEETPSPEHSEGGAKTEEEPRP